MDLINRHSEHMVFSNIVFVSFIHWLHVGAEKSRVVSNGWKRADLIVLDSPGSESTRV